MRKSVLKRTLSIVLACIMMMSIFAAIPMQANAADPIYGHRLSLSDPRIKFTAPKRAYYAEGGAPNLENNWAIRDTVNGRWLDSKDFSISYSGSFNVGGTVKVKFTGKGRYSGSKTLSVKVVKTPLTHKSITIKYASYYPLSINGGTFSPTVTVKDATGKTRYLSKGPDFTVSVSPNYAAKYANTKVIGVGCYTGTVSRTVTLK